MTQAYTRTRLPGRLKTGGIPAGTSATTLQLLADGITGAELYDLIEAGELTPQADTATRSKVGTTMELEIATGEEFTLAIALGQLASIADLTGVYGIMDVDVTPVAGTIDFAIGIASHIDNDDLDYSTGHWVGLAADIETDPNAYLARAFGIYQHTNIDRQYTGVVIEATSDFDSGGPSPGHQNLESRLWNQGDGAVTVGQAYSNNTASGVSTAIATALHQRGVINAWSDGVETQTMAIEYVRISA